jgi:hypothetical protein
MNWSWRYLLFREDGTVVKVPNSQFEPAYRGKKPLREFADQRVRLLVAQIELRNKTPHRILRYSPTVLWFDDRGFLQDDKEELHARLIMVRWHGAGKGTRRSFEERRAQQRLEREWEWEPTPADIAAVEKLIWPKGKPSGDDGSL